MTPGRPRVLLVEDRAHYPFGHYPERVADLAHAFVDLGHSVDVLTAQGWARGPSDRFTIHQYRPLTRSLAGRGPRWRVVMMTIAARQLRRSLGGPPVLVISYAVDPLVVAQWCGPGAWLVYVFGAAPSTRSTWWRRLRARRARRVGLAVPTPRWIDGWRACAPFRSVSTLGLSGSRRHPRAPDARARLGIDTPDRLALVFGARHDGKENAVIWRAARDLPGWTLLVAGQVTEEVPPDLDAIVWPGAIDPATRDLLFAASDAVVLSFVAGHARDSGVLTDAVSLGVPIVCSADSYAGDLVDEYGIGALFEPNDEASLRTALREVPTTLAPNTLERARLGLSNTVVALRFLDTLGTLS